MVADFEAHANIYNGNPLGCWSPSSDKKYVYLVYNAREIK